MSQLGDTHPARSGASVGHSIIAIAVDVSVNDAVFWYRSCFLLRKGPISSLFYFINASLKSRLLNHDYTHFLYPLIAGQFTHSAALAHEVL